MKSFKTRFLILFVLLVLSAITVRCIERQNSTAVTNADLSRIPLSIGEWRGTDVPLLPGIQDILETHAVIGRRYTKGDDIVWLTIVYYKNSRVSLHLPESCYLGSGSHLTNRQEKTLIFPGTPTFSAQTLTVKGDKKNLFVLYYFETEGYRTGSYQKMRWKAMLNRIQKHSANAALIRLSTPITDTPDQAEKVMIKFAAQAAPVISKYLR